MRREHKTTTWIVQDNLNPTGGLSTLDILGRACGEAERPMVCVKVVPFSTALTDMPDVPWPFVFYGYTTLITNAARNPRWRRGVFYDADVLRPSEYARHYGEIYLNADLETTTCEALAQRCMNPSERLFLRPNDDLKEWTGQVMTFADYLTWYAQFDPERRAVVVSVTTPKTITAEWRIVLVDGQVVGSSQYQPQALAWVPPEVEEFAERAAIVWCPLPVMVMDVASAGDELKVLELNCFNGSSFYVADVKRIVQGVSTYLESV